MGNVRTRKELKDKQQSMYICWWEGYRREGETGDRRDRNKDYWSDD